MRWLKLLVIGMGAAIVIGLTVVIVELVRRANEPAPSAAEVPIRPSPPVIGARTADQAPAPAVSFGDVRVAIPPGAMAQGVTTGDNRLVVRLRLPDGRTALLMLDPATGRKLGLITLDGGAKGP